MVTRLYLSRDDAPYSPTTKRGAWDTSTLILDNQLTRRRRGPSNTSGTAAESSATANFDRAMARFASEPLPGQTLPAGNFSFAIPFRESNALANDVAHIHIYVTTGDSDTPRGTILTDYIDTTEFVVNASTFDTISATGIATSSLVISTGDRLVIELGYQGQNTDATSYNAAFKVGGNVSDTSAGQTVISASDDTKAAWVEFDFDISWTWTYLYLTGSAAPVTPTTRGTWDDVAAFDDFLLGAVPAGARSTRTKTETVLTNPYDMLAHRFVSAPIGDMTISADIQFQKMTYESSSSADAFVKYHVYVMKPDGTVRGTLLSNIVGGSELSAIGVTAREAAQTPSSVAALNGDRIVLEVGARFTNAVITSFNTTHKSGGAGGEINDAGSILSDTDMSGWIVFKQELAAYVATPSGRGQAVVVL